MLDENRNLMGIALAILSERQENLLKEIKELEKTPFSNEGEERGNTNQGFVINRGRIISSRESLKEIRPALNSLHVAIKKGNDFNVCSICGVLFCWPTIIKHQERTPELGIPCVRCGRVKT